MPWVLGARTSRIRLVDATSVLFSKQELAGADGLEAVSPWRDRQDQFAKAMVHKLSAYALGRPLSFADDTDVDDITVQFRKQRREVEPPGGFEIHSSSAAFQPSLHTRELAEGGQSEFPVMGRQTSDLVHRRKLPAGCWLALALPWLESLALGNPAALKYAEAIL